MLLKGIKAVFSGAEFTKCRFEAFMFQNEAVATVVKFLAAINSGAEFTKCRFEAFMVQNGAVATVVKYLADINSAPDACSNPRHQRGSSSAQREIERARKNDRTENKFVFFLLPDLNSC